MFRKQLIFKSAAKEQLKRCSSESRTKKSSKPGLCLICGDKAKFINYGALSCQPCKTFFRRNGLHPERIPLCAYGGTCIITKETRRYCPSCRYARCIIEGMTADLIRKEEQRSKNTSSTSKYKRGVYTVNKSTMLPTHHRISDPPNSEQYFLLDHQKKILSNVVCALEIFSAIPKVRSVINDEIASIFGLPFDQSAVSQCIDYIHTSMRSFISCTPDFQILAAKERSSLIQRNFTTIVNLYSAVVFRQTGMMSRSEAIQSFASIYGSEMMFELVNISKQLKVDLTNIKLILLILAFSSNCSMVEHQPDVHHDSLLTGTHRLCGSQNVYVAVLWKYMVGQYGYYEAVCHFNRLIQFSLNLIKSSAITYMNYEIYHQLVNKCNENTKQLLATDQCERVRLWGMM